MYYFYEGRTLRGIEWVGWALIIFLAAALVVGVTAAVIGLVYGILIQNPANLLGPVVGVIAALCIAVVAELIAGILFLVGFFQIHAGRHEYGMEQTRSAERALVFLIIYVVLGAVSAAYTSSTSLLTGLVTPSTLPSAAGSLVLSPLGALFAGLTLEHAIGTLAAPGARSRLRTALLLGVVGAAVGPAITLLATAGGAITGDHVSAGIIAAALAGQGLAAISLLLFWQGYQETRRALAAGTPPPVLPRIEQVYPWLYRPWYAYPPAVPPPPQPPK